MTRCWLAGLLLLLGCGTSPAAAPADRPAPAPAPASAAVPACSATCLQQAVDRGVGYLARHLDEIDPTSLLVIDYLVRRYRVPLRHPVPQPQAGPSARLFGPAHRGDADRWPDLPLPDRFMAGVLACEHEPLDGADVADYTAAVELGGEAATHALWALSWSRDLGCVLPGGIAPRLAVRQLERELAGQELDDVGLQRLTYLALAGEDVQSGWPARVAAAQRPDGSWASGTAHEAGGQPDWHSTGLAVWFLLMQLQPGAPDPGFVPTL